MTTSEGITLGMEGAIKEWLESYRLVRQQQLGERPQKVRLGPCRQMSTLYLAPTMSLKRYFDSLKKTMHHQRMR